MLGFTPTALTLALALLGQTSSAKRASAKTITVTAPTSSATVTIVPGAITVISTTTSTTAAPVATVLATSISTTVEPDVTSTAVESATTTSTVTIFDPILASSTTWLEAPTSTVVESVSAVETVSPRDGFSNFFGCHVASQFNGAASAAPPFHPPIPKPFTASTAVAECYYRLASAQTDAQSPAGTTFTYCVISNDGTFFISSVKEENALPSQVATSYCNVPCDQIDASGVTNAVDADGYGLEYCGGYDTDTEINYVSVYTIDVTQTANPGSSCGRKRDVC